jgi:Domain of unknown function (DUF4396)
VLGVVMGTALGWSTAATIALAIGLAFVFGYSLTISPLVASGMALRAALGLALVADTASIVVMRSSTTRCCWSSRRDGRHPRLAAVLAEPRARAGRRVGRDLPGEPMAHRARRGHAAVHGAH